MEHTRNMQEWMRAVERKLANNNRSIGHVGRTVITDIREELVSSDTRQPTFPIEVTYQTALYIAPQSRQQRARLMVDFPDVTKATDGTDIEIASYELWGRDDTMNALEATTSAVPGVLAPGITFPGLAATQANKDISAQNQGPWKLMASSTASSLRAEGLIPGSVWSFKVRALGTLQKKPGLFSAEFQTQLDKDTEPPSQPTKPELTSSMGTIMIRWDGLSVNGAMPSDFEYVNVAHGSTASPTAVVTRFYRGGGIHVLSGFDYYAPQFVRFQAVDLSGNVSAWSEQAVGFTTPLVDTDIILSELDANTTLIKNIGAESLKSGAVLADKLADNAVTQGKLEQTIRDAVQQGADAYAGMGPLQIQASELTGRLNTAEQELEASDGRLTEAEGQLTDAFGQLGTVDSRISTAKSATLTEAAGTAQTKADEALAAANAQIAQVIARGASLVRNGDFEAGTDGWNLNSNAAVESGTSRSGTKALRIGPNPTTNVGISSEWVPGATERTYYVEMWVRRTGTEVKSQAIGFYVQGKTAAGGTSSPITGKVDSSTISTTGFTKVSVTYKVTTADLVAVRFAPWVLATNNTYHIDDFLAVDVTEAQAALDAAAIADGKAVAAQGLAGTADSNATAALNMATSKNRVYYSTAVATGTGSAAGDLWRQRNAQNEVIAEWQWSATPPAGSWVKQTVSGMNVSNMDIGYLTAGAATMSQALIDKLVAGTAQFQTVDVKNLFATAGTMQQATIDKLWAEVVNAKKITADMLLVGTGSNLINWKPGDTSLFFSQTSGGGTTFAAANDSDAGGACVRVFAPNVTPGTFQYTTEISSGVTAANGQTNAYDIVGGEPYRFEMQVTFGGNTTAPATTQPTVRMMVRWFNGANTSLGDSTFNEGAAKADYDGATVVYEGIAPATAVAARLYMMQDQPSNDGGHLYLSKFYFSRKVSSVLIQDGAVNADKVDAQSVAGAVGSFIQLNVSQLNATSAGMTQAVIDKLWTDVVRAKKITTDMLIVSSGNMVWNGGGENGDNTSWSGWTYDAADKPPGVIGSFAAPAITTTLNLANNQPTMPVEADTFYVFEFWLKASVANSRTYIEFMETGGSNPSPQYAATNFLVPTAWTKFTVPVKTSVGQTHMYMRMYVNHTNGTVTNATQKIAGVVLRKQDGATLIAAGGIATTHLATDSVTAAKIKALEIAAGHIAANAVEADKIKAGAVTAVKLEAELALVTKIIAGPVLGTHAEMNASGFKVFAEDPETGLPYETVRMGVADTSDLLSITNSVGESVINLDSLGTIAGKSVEAENTLYYKGEELSSYVGSRPRGMAAWAQVEIKTNMAVSNGTVGLFELAWDGGDIPGRMYEFNVNTFIVNASAAGTVGMRLFFTTDGSAPTINSPTMQYNYIRTSAAGFVSLGGSRIVGSNNGNYIRVLVALYASSGVVATVTLDPNQTHLLATVMDLGESMPPTGVASTGGGTPYSGSTVAPPTIAKVTKTLEYGYTSVKSYLPNNSQYQYNIGKAYQGLSPAGYGNLRSIYSFNQDFVGLLNGATIEGVWIYIYFEHWYYNAGGSAIIRLHNQSGAPSTYTGVTGNGFTSSGWPKAAGRWVSVPSNLWAGFASGAYKGFALIGDSSYGTYGIANNARLKFKFTK